jgi:hypothetical protein
VSACRKTHRLPDTAFKNQLKRKWEASHLNDAEKGDNTNEGYTAKRNTKTKYNENGYGKEKYSD